MDGSPEATLPPLYAPWVREIVGGPIPRETVATCDHCVMLPPEGAQPAATFFLPGLKCCAYQPTIPNFLAGRILADADPSLAKGRAALEERIDKRVNVLPLGIRSSGVFQLLYSHTPNVFGRAPDLRCPYLVGDGDCGIWRHRPGVCCSWFCKYVRGETGRSAWMLVDKLLRAVEIDLSIWCAAELGADPAAMAILATEPFDRPDVSELGGPIDSARYREMWGEWAGRERELYAGAARLVDPMGWDRVLAICGPAVGILAQQLRDAARRLTSDEIPARLRLGSYEATRGEGGRILATSYSSYDPLTFPEALADALRTFDGRPTEDALAAILAERNLALDRSLVRRLVDFGILKPA